MNKEFKFCRLTKKIIEVGNIKLRVIDFGRKNKKTTFKSLDKLNDYLTDLVNLSKKRQNFLKNTFRVKESINFINKNLEKEIKKLFELTGKDFVRNKIPFYTSFPDIHSWRIVTKTLNSFKNSNKFDFAFYFFWTQFVFIIRDFLMTVIKKLDKFYFQKEIKDEINNFRKISVKLDDFSNKEGSFYESTIDPENTIKEITFYDFRNFFHHPFNIEIKFNNVKEKFYSDIEFKNNIPIIWLINEDHKKWQIISLKNSFLDELLKELKWLLSILILINSNLEKFLLNLKEKTLYYLEKMEINNLSNVKNSIKSVNNKDFVIYKIEELIFIKDTFMEKWEKWAKEFINSNIYKIKNEFNNAYYDQDLEFVVIREKFHNQYPYYRTKIENYWKHDYLYFYKEFEHYIPDLKQKEFYLILEKASSNFDYKNKYSQNNYLRIVIDFYEFICWKFNKNGGFNE